MITCLAGTDLIVVNSETLSPGQEMVEDLMTSVDCFPIIVRAKEL
jgi:hypothetical protein